MGLSALRPKPTRHDRTAFAAGVVPLYQKTAARMVRRPRSQGGVEIPTGGKCEKHKPASACRSQAGRVSRFGAKPKPTVIVRMKENGVERIALFRRGSDACPAVPGSHVRSPVRPGSGKA